MHYPDKNYIFPSIIALAIIISAFVFAGAYKYKFKDKKRVIVTGMASKDFVSDLIVWEAYYARSSMDLKMAYATLKSDEIAIKAYLSKKGVEANQTVFSAVSINKMYNPVYDQNGRLLSNDFSGYSLTQNVKVESKAIEKVEKISREITELIQSGIELNSSAPSYYYTKMAELKIDLLAKASKDAKDRAMSITENAGSNIGDLKYANMGVFQITGQNSNENYSYGGAFNTSSKNKTASITLRTEYAVN